MSMAEPFVPRSAEDADQLRAPDEGTEEGAVAAGEQAHFDDVLRRERGNDPLFPTPDPAVTRTVSPAETPDED